MSDATDPLAWAERAEEDFLVARSSLRYRKPLTHVACFHAQQCAENYIKALLLSKGETFGRTHDLLLLTGQCEKAGVWLPVAAEQLNALSEYGVRVRYPGDDPTPEEARHAVQIAREVGRVSPRVLGLN
jgi:HEPN domain-containing protein